VNRVLFVEQQTCVPERPADAFTGARSSILSRCACASAIFAL
jgi:hypothetical protein